MHIVAVAWIFVVGLMALAEATSTQGSVLGAAFTFLLYGALPLAIVLYIMGTPMRRRARRLRELRELHEFNELHVPGSMGVDQPRSSPDGDASGHAPGAAIAPVGKEA